MEQTSTAQVAKLVDDYGAPEVLRAVASILADYDSERAQRISQEVYLLADDLGRDAVAEDLAKQRSDSQ